ncbi:MAG: AsmA-like C-terminal domain-containing protein [Campylobacterota bacterium]
MKDAIITKVIPTIHKRIVLFFFTLFFLGFFTFIALLEGFGIDRLTLGGVKIEKLYLKWNNALLIKASRVDLSGYRGDGEPVTLKPLERLPRIVRWGNDWVESIRIDQIRYKHLSASLRYDRDQAGTVIFKNGRSSCRGEFRLDERHFRLAFPQCSVGEANVSFSLAIDLPRQLLDAQMRLALPQTPEIRLSAQGDAQMLRFRAAADTPLHTLRPLVTFLDIDPEVAPWIADYAKASSIRLDSMEGHFRYDEPGDLVRSLHARATLYDAEYTFAQGFEPIKAPIIRLSYERGKLHIVPQQGSFYAMPTEKSRLWIDFTTPNTTLSALIKTDRARLGDPILNLLRYYEIDLPIKQLAGECAVDLALKIDLHTFDTLARGTFVPTASELLLGDTRLRTTGGIVHLDTTRVRFERFNALYGDNTAHARVSGVYDATREEGNVSIEAYRVSPLGNDGYLRLSEPSKPLRVDYRIAPSGDSINVHPSTWNLFGETLLVSGFKAPFDYANMRLSLAPLPFQVPGKLKGNVSARFDGTKERTGIRLQIDDLNLHGAFLVHKPFVVSADYDGNALKLSAPAPSSWSLNRLPILVSPFNAVWKNDQLTFNEIETVAGDWFKATLSGSYHTLNKKGSLKLHRALPINPKLTPFINPDESVDLFVNAGGEELVMEAPALKARFTTIPQGWQVALEDISRLSRRSPLLRRYHIHNGNLQLYYTGERSQYRFSGSIRYPYPLVLVNDVPLSHYRFSGSYKDGDSSIRVSDRLVIDHTPQRTYVRANNAGINVPALFKFLSAFSDGGGDAESQTVPVRIHATHTYLHLMKGRKIVADTLDATMDERGFEASLAHESGLASLQIREGAFLIEGKSFNDTFMKHLFALSDFDGGAFSFEAKGTAEAFDGLMRVENTVLKDYKVLNNVLAFVNTVPSLATFSLPNYHSKGLPVKEGYAHFNYRKGVLKVDNFTLNSPEMKILGEGKADLNTNTIEGGLTLKTDLGSKLGKVPMVGYILLGDDGSVSTTLTLSGSLEDPKIETAIAKEIVTAPFNILKRTLVYPFLWMLDDEKKK